MTTQFVTVLNDDVYGLMEKINKLNRRAEKLGFEPMLIVNRTNGKADGPMGTLVDVATFEIEGLAPRLNGWTLLTKIDHTEDGNIVRTFGGETDDVYRTIAPNCEHCGHNRHRNTTFIIQNEDGTKKQVGSTCIEDFTRSSFLFYASRADDLMDYVDGLGKLARTVSVRAVLAHATAIIAENGFARSGSTDVQPTWQLVKDNINAQTITEKLNATPVTEADLDYADKVLEWAREGGNNDYRHNLSIATAHNFMDEKYYPLVVSAVSAYKTMELRKTQTATPTVTEWFGNIKDKITATVTINRIASFATQFGMMDVITMTSGSNVFVWKTTSYPEWVEQGKTVTIKGTIKAHDTYRDTKQTVLTRVKTV